jgi:hypothetical protein
MNENNIEINNIDLNINNLELIINNKKLCNKLKELYDIVKIDKKFENIEDFFKRYRIKIYKLDDNLYYLNTEKYKSLVINNEFNIISNNFYDIIKYFKRDRENYIEKIENINEKIFYKYREGVLLRFFYYNNKWFIGNKNSTWIFDSSNQNEFLIKIYTIINTYINYDNYLNFLEEFKDKNYTIYILFVDPIINYYIKKINEDDNNKNLNGIYYSHIIDKDNKLILKNDIIKDICKKYKININNEYKFYNKNQLEIILKNESIDDNYGYVLIDNEREKINILYTNDYIYELVYHHKNLVKNYFKYRDEFVEYIYTFRLHNGEGFDNDFVFLERVYRKFCRYYHNLYMDYYKKKIKKKDEIEIEDLKIIKDINEKGKKKDIIRIEYKNVLDILNNSIILISKIEKLYNEYKIKQNLSDEFYILNKKYNYKNFIE